MRSIDIARKRKRVTPLYPSPLSPPTGGEGKGGGKKFWPWVAAAAALLVIAVASYTLLPKAHIKIEARSEPVTRDLEIAVDTKQTNPDSSNLIVPGRVEEEEIAGQKTFAATGGRNIGEKASGFVNIYNFTKTALILKKDTTTLTAGGREYFFTQDVGNIRPTAFIGLEQQEVDPTSLIPPVPVVAAEPGEPYNLPKESRLEIQNEAFGSNPRTLYSVAAVDGLSGGSTRTIKFVTELDITNGYRALEEELAKGRETQILEQSATAKPGDERPEFEVKSKIKVRGLTFEESDVRAVVRQRLERLLPENKQLLSGQSERLQTQTKSADFAAGTGVLAVHFEGEIVYVISREDILRRVRGKSADEIKEILLSRPDIERVSVDLSPFWVKTAPKYSKKITLDIE